MGQDSVVLEGCIGRIVFCGSLSRARYVVFWGVVSSLRGVVVFRRAQSSAMMFLTMVEPVQGELPGRAEPKIVSSSPFISSLHPFSFDLTVVWVYEQVPLFLFVAL